MAKQGNYVTLPGGSGPNPFKGVSDSLANLSKTYATKDALNREEALKREKLAQEQQRWDIQNQRQKVIADRESEAYNIKKATTDWYKNFGNIYDPDTLRKQKAKQYFGVTDEQLSGKVGRQILDAVPVYQEDVADFYGKEFTSRFGTPFDAAAVKSHYGDLSALSTLQAAEDENAKRRFETAKFFIGKRIDAAGKLGPNGTAGSSKGKSSKQPKTYNDIMIADLVKDFDSDSWFMFDSEKEDARDVAKYTLDVIKSTQTPNKTQKYDAAQAKAMTEFVLDRLRVNDDLKGVDDAKGKIADLIVEAEEGMTNSYKGDYTGSGGRKGNDAAKAYLEGALSTDLDPNAFSPRNIRTIRRTAAQQAIDRLLGRKPKIETEKPVRVERPTISGQNKRWPLDARPTENGEPEVKTSVERPLPTPEQFQARKNINFFRNVPPAVDAMYNADSTKQLAREILSMPPAYREGVLRNIKTKYGESGEDRVQAIRRHILEARQ